MTKNNSNWKTIEDEFRKKWNDAKQDTVDYLKEIRKQLE